MDTQIFIIIFIGFSLLVLLVFGIDIYYLTKKTKKEIGEKGIQGLNLSQGFLKEIEQTIQKETEKNISEINQKISEKTIDSYQKQINIFLKESQEKLATLEESTKKGIASLHKNSTQAEKLIFDETKKIIEKLGKNMEEKTEQIYRVAIKSASQKMAETEKNIENYEKEKLKEIDQKIIQIIESTVKKTVGKMIDTSTHEKLVIEALEKSKKEIF